MLFIDERCRACGKSIAGAGPDYRAIGMPIVECPHCGSVNRRSGRVNEWELIPSDAKLSLAFLAWFWNTGYVLLAVLFVGLPLMRAAWPDAPWGPLNEDAPFDLPSVTIFLSFVGGLGALVAWLRMRRQIAASKFRMSHAAYREALRQIGIF